MPCQSPDSDCTLLSLPTVFLSSVHRTHESRHTQPVYLMEKVREKTLPVAQRCHRLSGKKTHLSQACFLRLKKRLYRRLKQFLGTPTQEKDAQRLTKHLNRYKQALFTFLEHEGVCPYNNHAEQQMRKTVLTRKALQQSCSEDGAKTPDILMSLLRSAELQGINPVENLLASTKNALTVKTSSGLASLLSGCLNKYLL